MFAEVAQAVGSILVGCLVGMLAYLVPAALSLGRPTMASPRAVVRVSEQLCESNRCASSGRSAQPGAHLVEVEVLERTTTLLKVRWPRGFGHLDQWIPIQDVSGATSVVEELPAYPLWSSSEFEAWLTTVGADLDALDTATLAPPRHPAG